MCSPPREEQVSVPKLPFKNAQVD